MVDYHAHHSETPLRPGRVRIRGHPPAEDGRRRCEVCGCYLAADRPVTVTRCSCHGPSGEYNPRHDKALDERVLAVLRSHQASGVPVNVWRALGTENYAAIWESVARLRSAGHDILGIRGFGYILR